MTRPILLTICCFQLLTSVAYGDDLGPNVGSVTVTDSGPEYHLYKFYFGIEQWENGKHIERMNELWWLECASKGVSKNPKARCVLEQTKLWELFEDEVYPSIHMYDSTADTLKVDYVDWELGKLDFTLFHKDKSTTTVKIRMLVKGKNIYLRSFQALGISRGIFNGSLSDNLVPVEKRIAPYTHTLNIPIKMRGMRPESEKNWNNLLSSLSQKDLEAWEAFMSVNTCNIFVRQNVGVEVQDGKELINWTTFFTNWKERVLGAPQFDEELKGDEKTRIIESTVMQTSECLASSSISPEGQKMFLGHFREIFYEFTQ